MRTIASGTNKLYIGTVRSDESHRDGTIEFVRLINELMSYQEGGIRIEAPAISMSTVELIRVSKVPASLLAWSHSCHKANTPCGACRGCNKYLETYLEVGYELDDR
jgi:7-cyano-7-deazaguanine synthase